RQGRCCFAPIFFHRLNETVASPGERFDEAGIFRRIAQGFAQLLDSVIQATIKVHKSVRGPDPLLQFLAGDNFARMFQQDLQNLEGLFLKSDFHALLVQFSALSIQLEDTEAEERSATTEIIP